MPLSPRDIRSQTFKKTFLGYKAQDVDFFLEEIAKSIDDSRRQIDHYKTEKEHSLECIESFEAQTSAVKETLELAREKSKKIFEDSKKSAQEIIIGAQEQAEKTLMQYQDEFNRRKLVLQRLKSISDSYKRRFQLVLKESVLKLEEFERSVDARNVQEFIKDIPSEAIICEPIQEWYWARNSKFPKRK